MRTSYFFRPVGTCPKRSDRQHYEQVSIHSCGPVEFPGMSVDDVQWHACGEKWDSFYGFTEKESNR